jgi:hypothetical protein
MLFQHSFQHKTSSPLANEVMNGWSWEAWGWWRYRSSGLNVSGCFSSLMFFGFLKLRKESENLNPGGRAKAKLDDGGNLEATVMTLASLVS